MHTILPSAEAIIVAPLSQAKGVLGDVLPLLGAKAVSGDVVLVSAAGMPEDKAR